MYVCREGKLSRLAIGGHPVYSQVGHSALCVKEVWLCRLHFIHRKPKELEKSVDCISNRKTARFSVGGHVIQTFCNQTDFKPVSEGNWFLKFYLNWFLL